ncbi:MAG TPA: CHAP domain-containing protein [Candidatus Saccharimonadales bacterium]|nr:CHAP domain-containing protein [Candidatus Saccharimonadales bacterium]
MNSEKYPAFIGVRPDMAVSAHDIPMTKTVLRKLGLLAASGLLAAGGASACVITDIASAPPAQADTTTKIPFENDYPYANAKLLDLQNFDWWMDENGNGRFDGQEQYSPLGYGYRNCTDGVAYWAKKYDGVNIGNWGDALVWDVQAGSAGYAVKAGSANNIEPGDIAQSDDGKWGHVGFVTDVIKNDAGTVVKLKIAEYNHNSDGAFTHEAYISKNAAGNFIRNSRGYT